MKKMFLSMAFILTIAATAFTGTTIQASAQSTDDTVAAAVTTPADNNDSSVPADNDSTKTVFDTDPQGWLDDDEDFSIVRGAPDFIEVRTSPIGTEGTVVGTLKNGQEVIMTTRWEGDYVLVYCPELDSYGWVDGIYLG